MTGTFGLLFALWMPALLHWPRLSRHAPANKSGSSLKRPERSSPKAPTEEVITELVMEADLIAFGFGPLD